VCDCYLTTPVSLSTSILLDSYIKRSFKWKPEKLCKIHNMKQPVITLLYVTRWRLLATCGYTKPSHGRSWNYQLKMATPLQSCTKQEMWSVIQFPNAEGAKPVEIYIRMLAKYGASCMSKTSLWVLISCNYWKVQSYFICKSLIENFCS
jgi:hypothetical protein